MILFFITICIALLGILKRSSKIVFGIIIAWTIFLTIGITTNADYSLYEQMYESYGRGELFSYELLFVAACKFFYFLGFSYETFRVFFCIIALYLVFDSIYKYTSNYSLVAGLYLISTFFIDIVQIRNFMSMAIILYGIRFLLNEEDKYSLLKYGIVCLIAGLIQYIGYVYIIFSLTRIKLSFKKAICLYVIVALLEVLLIKLGIFTHLLKIVMPQQKYYEYIYSSKWQIGAIGTIQCILVHIVTIVYLMGVYFINKHYIIEKKDNKEIDFIVYLNIIMISLFGLYMYTFEFLRIIRNTFLLDNIFASKLLTNKLSRNNVYITYVLILFSCSIFGYFILYFGLFDKTVMDSLKYNYWNVLLWE